MINGLYRIIYGLIFKCIYRLYMDYTWIIHGLYMDYTWIKYGLYMDSIWIIYGFYRDPTIHH